MNFFILSFLLLFPLLFHNPEKSAFQEVGSPGSLRFRSRLLTVDANEGIAIADVNGDGKLDVVAGRNWFPAPDFAPRPLRQIADWNGYVESNGDFAFDVNHDERPDIVAGSFLPSEVFWYENPGVEKLQLGQVWKRHLLVDTKTSNNEGSFLHDLDGDGKPEWITNSWNPATPVTAWSFESDADGQPTLVRHLIGDQGQAHGMGFGDVNNDGRQDILLGNGWYECPPGDIWSAKWKHHPDWDLGAVSLPILVRDLNGDGLNDFVWGKGHDYGLFWSEALGTKSADGKLLFKSNLVDESYSQAHAIHFADLDHDGVDELISGKRFRAHNGSDPGGDQMACIYYYKWDSATNAFSRHVIDEGHIGIGLQIRTADLNGDGKLDIAVAGKDGTWILFQE